MSNKMTRTIVFQICCLTLLAFINNSQLLAQQESKGIHTIYLIRHGDYAPQDDGIPDSFKRSNSVGHSTSPISFHKIKINEYKFQLIN